MAISRTLASLIAVVVLFTFSSAARAGTIAHWTFDEMAGTIAADAGGTYNQNGVLKPATASGGVNLNTAGVFGSAVDLDGVSGSYFTVPYIDGVHVNDFTVAAWVNPDDTGINSIFGDWTSTHAHRFWTQNNLRAQMRRASGAPIDMISSNAGSITPGTWQHVAYAWDRTSATTGTMSYYLNGALVGSQAATGGGSQTVNVVNNNRNDHLGWKQDSGNTFNGKMDEQWILDQALTASQVNHLKNNNNTSFSSPYTTPVAHWSFDETSGTSVSDSGPGRSPGTIVNALGGDTNLNTPTSTFGGSSLFLSNGSDRVGVERISMHDTSFTISAWVNPTSLANGDEIFGDWSSHHQFRLFLNANGSVSANLRRDGAAGNNGNIVAPTTAAGLVSTDDWAHVLLRWDRDTKTADIFVDNVLAATATSGLTNVNLKHSFHSLYNIGLKADGGGTFHGYMDELWVVDYAVEDWQVGKLFTLNTLMSPEPSALILASFGLLSLGFVGWRRRRRA